MLLGVQHLQNLRSFRGLRRILWGLKGKRYHFGDQWAKLDAENSLTKEIQKYQPGDEIRLKIWHDGEEREEAVTLQERKE